jgi:drug/metabolite transporter (DMT)-like permease
VRARARAAATGSGAGTAAGLAAVGIWGMAPVATRALVLQLAPLPLLVVRMGVAALVLLPWCRPVLRGPGRAYLPRLFVAGLLGMVGYNLPVTFGLQRVPAATAGLVLASEPVWLLVLAAAFLGERASRRSWAGAVAALAGVGVLAGPGVLSPRGGARELAGVSLVALGTLLFAAYTLMMRPLSRACGPVPATAASTVAGSVCYAAFAGTVSPDQLSRLPAGAWGELAFLAIGSNVVGMLAWNLAVVRLPGPRAGLLLYLEPLVSVAGAVALLGERLTAGVVAGGVLILGGIAATWTPIRPGCGPPRSRSGPLPARTCPSAGPRSGAGSPAPRPTRRKAQPRRRSRIHAACGGADRAWLSATWPFVRGQLPPARRRPDHRAHLAGPGPA